MAYPLSAVVGQEGLVEALLINAVSPEVGGVLVRGQRGTAKSTAVRALAPLLPPVDAARDGGYAFAPGDHAPDGPVPAGAPTAPRAAALVELPLGATLDRLVGALDLGRALAGERAFEPGLLARAHRGILYVDEVNLLADHLVDAVLDAAASGVARVEREAVSVEHDARFLLVGTMNPEEGELRPQLLDRFGLGVDVTTPTDPAQRAEIVRRRLAFERDPEAFVTRWADAERELAARIAAARDRLTRVVLPERELARITGACAKLELDGVRGDIVTARAARALAALEAATEVDAEHVRRAAALALAHRRRRDPLDDRGGGEEELERALTEHEDDGGQDPEPPGGGGGNGGAPAPPPAGGQAAGGGGAPAGESTAPVGAEPEAPGDPAQGEQATGPQAGRRATPTGEQQEAPGSENRRAAEQRRDAPAAARLPLGALTLTGTGEGPAGRRARSASPGAGSIDARPAVAGMGGVGDLAVVATLQARLIGDDTPREHVRAGRESALLCLVVDASGSMGARRRLARVKGALLEVLRDAYARRDRVAVIAFRDGDARTVAVPGAPVEQAAAAIRDLATGGRTPLAAGLAAAER
ncbi:MAG TPA: ATP-binding protein, partial [Solirubrobacteraceae bacterium]|nr:ATP-binding protein [Solirubrobacteraceae bacterium]